METPSYASRRGSHGVSPHVVALAALLGLIAGCPHEPRPDAAGTPDATAEVSALYFQSLEDPSGVDPLIDSGPEYRSDAVQQCLETIAQNSAVAAGEWLDTQQQINAQIQTIGGSNQPGTSMEGGLLLWSSSMLSAVRGTPWTQTEHALLSEQIWQTLYFLMTPEEWSEFVAVYFAILDEANETGQPWIMCP